MLSGPEYVEECNRQGVDLHVDVSNVLLDPYIAQDDNSHILFAASSTGQTLDDAPKTILTAKIIEITPMIEDDTAAKTLTRMINNSRQAVSDTSLPRLSRGELVWAESCTAAELRFLQTLHALGKISDSGFLGPGLKTQIVMDKHQPIIVRKGNPVKSGLTLVDINVDGHLYPAGSIVAMGLSQTDDSGGYEGFPEDGLVKLVKKEWVRKIRFLRLSDFILRKQERKELLSRSPALVGKQETREKLVEIGLAQINEMVAQAAAKLQ